MIYMQEPTTEEFIKVKEKLPGWTYHEIAFMIALLHMCPQKRKKFFEAIHIIEKELENEN